MKFVSQAVFAAAVLAAPAAFALPVNLITNGSFEVTSPTTPTTGLVNGATYVDMPTTGSNWDVFNALPGWTAGVGDAGIEAQTANTLTTINPYDGAYYVELDSDNDYAGGGGPVFSNSSMSQEIKGLSAGDYQLSFAYSPRTNPTANDSNRIDFTFDSLFSGTVSSDLGVTGAAVTGSSLAPTPTAVGTWSIATVLFNIATAGDYTLKFAANGADNTLGGFIDDVRLSAVPLPAPALLLFGALASFGMLRRYRTA